MILPAFSWNNTVCPLEDKVECPGIFVLSCSSGTDNDNRLQVILVVACSFIL